ncbi:MAG: hypothetical protein JXQ27_09965 [Acidobacteria bacterium]|nr:hypothetical protein [Acidobacteriota bacterium]
MIRRKIIPGLILVLALPWATARPGLEFPVSERLRHEYGTTIHGVSLLPSANGYYTGSYNRLNGDVKREFTFSRLARVEHRTFTWVIYNDACLEPALRTFFADGSAETFWGDIQRRLHDLAGRIIGQEHNAMFLTIYLVPAGSRLEEYHRRYHPTHVPMEFWFELPATAITDQDFRFVTLIAHEYAHLRLQLAGFDIRNVVSEEVVVRTFEMSFMALFSDTCIIGRNDGHGGKTPVALPVTFPEAIPTDMDQQYLFSQEIMLLNIAHALGSNRVESRAEKTGLLALAHALFRHPHDFTRSFFPLDLVEPLELPTDWFASGEHRE